MFQGVQRGFREYVQLDDSGVPGDLKSVLWGPRGFQGDARGTKKSQDHFRGLQVVSGRFLGVFGALQEFERCFSCPRDVLGGLRDVLGGPKAFWSIWRAQRSFRGSQG